MDKQVLELVVFTLRDGVTPERLMETSAPVSEWIAGRPGFVSRELCRDEDGDRWIDVVWWRTLEDAQAASELALSSEACAPMFALIDMERTLMLHGRLRAAAP